MLEKLIQCKRAVRANSKNHQDQLLLASDLRAVMRGLKAIVNVLELEEMNTL